MPHNITLAHLPFIATICSQIPGAPSKLHQINPALIYNTFTVITALFIKPQTSNTKFKKKKIKLK